MTAAWTWLVCMAVVGSAGCRRASTPVDPMGTGSRDDQARVSQAGKSHGSHTGQDSQAAKESDEGDGSKPTSVQATEPLILQRREFELAEQTIRQWLAEASTEARPSVTFMGAELSPDGHRLALSVKVRDDSRSQCVVFVFDLEDPKWAIRTLSTCGLDASFSMDGRHLATHGYPDFKTEVFEMWDVEQMVRLGQRYLEYPRVTEGRRMPSRAMSVKGQAVDADGDASTSYRFQSDVALRALGSRRALAMTSPGNAFSFLLADGRKEGYPDALLFGRRADTTALGDACVVAWNSSTGDTRIYATDPPALRHRFVLPPVHPDPKAGHVDVKFASSATCDVVFAFQNDEASIYRTSTGELLFRHSADPRSLEILHRTFVHRSSFNEHFDQIVVSDLFTGHSLATAKLDRRFSGDVSWREMVGDPRPKIRGVELRWERNEGPESVGVWIWEGRPR